MQMTFKNLVPDWL